MQIQKNVSLKPFNTFGIQAKAAYFCEINSAAALTTFLQENKTAHHSPLLILGGGSNLLFTKDFPGIVLKNNIGGIQVVKEDENNVWIRAGGGENWHAFVLHCINLGYGGIENLSLIPGTMGAAPMQNIGAYGVEIKDVFEQLEAIAIESGELHYFNNADCQFGYRESVFKNIYKDQFIITAVTLKLSRHPVINTSYGAIEQTLQSWNITVPTIRDVSNAVIHIRQSKLPNPADIGNAGSFFKNPVVSRAIFDNLKAEYPEIPGYEVSEQEMKVPAGWLIEQCGWKGKRFGEVGVHKNQALVLVNYGNANGEAVKELAYKISASVAERFGIELTPEVNMV